jgi:steroid delta-isomerase-like uncharacterized protein
MSTETNKAMLRRFFDDVVNKQNVAMLSDIVTADYVNHNLPAPAPGPEGMSQAMSTFFSGFPDLKVTIHDMIAEGNEVSSRGTWSGTHRGAFMGVAATGKQVAVDFIDIWRVANGKFVENWVQMDLLGLMQQLGVVPEPAQAGA